MPEPKPVKITFLTRHYPPSPNINGESVCDMVQYLQSHYGAQCTIVTIDRQVEGGGNRREPAGVVHSIRPLLRGQGKLSRMVNFLYEGFRLAWRARRRHADSLIVVTTSPPLLPFWASMLFGRGMRWAFWALDLFPEGFAATGLIKESNWLYRFFRRKTYSGQPKRLIALGPGQAAHLEALFPKPPQNTSVLPCGVFFYQDKSPEAPDWYRSDRLILGYCGNVHDAHNPDFIRAAIDCIDPERHLLVLALYGSKAPALKAYAQGKPGVVLVEGGVPRNRLHFIDIHLVSLTRKWTHIAVPSKAVSAITMGCPILFCGSPDSDNWGMFRQAGWLIDEGQDLNLQMQTFLNELSTESLQARREQTPALYEQLKQRVLDAYAAVYEEAADWNGL